MVFMMGVFASLERNLTVERIRSSIANAKSKGIHMRRPRKTLQDVPDCVKSLLPDIRGRQAVQSRIREDFGHFSANAGLWWCTAVLAWPHVLII